MELSRAREIIREELPRMPGDKIDIAAVVLVLAANVADLRKVLEKKMPTYNVMEP